MRRYLIVAPDFKDWDLGAYVQQILSVKGLSCDSFAYASFRSRREANHALLRAASGRQYDVILGLKLDRIEANTIRKLRASGIFCFLWYVDCFEHAVPRWIQPLVREADSVAITAKGLIPLYSRFSRKPVSWIYEGVHLPSFPLSQLTDVPKVYKSEVAFVGNIYYPMPNPDAARTRHSLLKRVQERFELKVWGVQGDPQSRQKWGRNYPVIEWPAYNQELVQICRGAAIVLGINRLNNVELYFSNRTFLTLASGGFHITRYVPGLETMFRNEEHLVWYHSNEECLRLIDYYLRRPNQRRRIAAAGRAWVRRRYGMTRQTNRILRMIDQHYGN